MIANIEQKFDLRSHLDKLEPTKRKNRYICPVCGGNDLTIDPKTGKYQCWHGCSCRDIREAVSPWDEVKKTLQDNPTRKTTRSQPHKKPKPVPIPAGELVLAFLPEKPTDHPQTNKNPFIPDWLSSQGVPSNATETRYWYSQTQWVSRFEWEEPENPSGHDKTIRQGHIKPDGTTKWAKGNQDWKPYRLEEAILRGKGKWVLGLEGEPCVEIARSLQLAAITWQGGSWTDTEIGSGLWQLKQEGVPGLVYWRDRDEAGEKKARQIQDAAAKIKFPVIVLDPLKIWENMPHKGDLADWVAWGQAQGMNTEDFIGKLEQEIHSAVEARRQQQPSSLDEAERIADEDFSDSIFHKYEYTQETKRVLYSDQPWICVFDQLYYWNGNHYKHSPDVVERRKIAEFLNDYGVPVKKGNFLTITYPYAKASCVNAVLDWIKANASVAPELVNPPGINCTNGVLKINWLASSPSWALIPHDPSQYYLYEPIVTYNPNADEEACNKLLEALEPEQQTIFLRTIAASLDLKTVRKYKGRMVRALLLKGLGSNGKDTLREVVRLMYGKIGLTGCTLSDFAQYDNGRKFPLAKLGRARVNWASENANFIKLDSLQSLKAAITGDSLSVEGKGKDENEYDPTAVLLFNCNDVPRLTGTMEAIASRYGVLTFNKTFKIHADTSIGEIEADPRFKYDPDFLQHSVLSAFLNRVLSELVNLMRSGIDYSSTEKAMRDIQAENSHLMRWSQETGLSYVEGSELRIKEIWERLEQWYLDNGYLSYEESSNGKKRAIWVDPASKSDRLVKGANQIVQRLSEIFPKAKYLVLPGSNARVLRGIGFLDQSVNQFEQGVNQFVNQSPKEENTLESLPNQGFNDSSVNHLTTLTSEDGKVKNFESKDKVDFSEPPLDFQKADPSAEVVNTVNGERSLPKSEQELAAPLTSSEAINEAVNASYKLVNGSIASSVNEATYVIEKDNKSPFQPGDWVYHENFGDFGVVLKVVGQDVFANWNTRTQWNSKPLTSRYIRHAKRIINH
jgi:putative DNA primase/helicase